MKSKLIERNFLELVPRDPPAAMLGLVLVGRVFSIDGAEFTLHVEHGRDNALLQFRVDQNEEIAVKIDDGSTWEIGRSSAKLR